MHNEKYMVSVICFTYNHAKYIREALDSFVNQNTTFEYEVLVHDDASTDGTTEIIREYAERYPQIIKPIYEDINVYNKMDIFADVFMPRVNSKYIALCDGDDYWISSDKLQKQVEFMEGHPDFSVYIHNGYKYYQDEEKFIPANTFKESRVLSTSENIELGLGSVFAISSSLLMRRSAFDNMPRFVTSVKSLDYSLRSFAGLSGQSYYDEEIMAVYRIAGNTSFMSKLRNPNVYQKYTLEMMNYFHEFDIYTKRKYHDLFHTKIISDCIGFCSVTGKQDIQSMTELPTFISQMYDMFDENSLFPPLLKMFQEKKKVYIYGIGRLAEILYQQICNQGYDVSSFVVSDGINKPISFKNKNVEYIGNVIADQDTVIALAMQPINAMNVAKNLKRIGFINIIQPYNMIDKD